MPAASWRYLSLDCWRGLACLTVIVFHASGRQPDAGSLIQEVIARLAIGVPIFFVISGYCITASLQHGRDASLVNYFIRRFRRALPAYWATLVAVALAMLALDAAGHPEVLAHNIDGFGSIVPPERLSLWQWLGSVSLIEGWRGHFVGGDGEWYLGHTWTLGYQEQFYAVAGMLMALAARHWFMVVALVTAAVVAIASLVPHDLIGGFWFNGRWLAFACGIGLFYHLSVARGIRRAIVPGALAALALWRWLLPGAGTPVMLHEIAVAIVAALVLIALHRHDASLASLRVMRPLAWCGIRCYSIYLVHWPIAKVMFWAAWNAGVHDPHLLMLVVVPSTMALALLCGALFYRFVEQPCLGPGRRTRPAPSPVSLPATPTISPA